MAKKNKKGGWTGTAVGSNAVKSGGGPQVEKNFGELKKYDTKRTPFQKASRVLLFVLVCALAGNLIYQATPKNMAEYWGVDEQKDAITAVEITVYPESGDEETAMLTSAADIEAFFTALDESELKRLWEDLPDRFRRGPVDTSVPAFTSEIRIYLEGNYEPAFQAGFVKNKAYFLYMPTYLWYLPEGAPLLDYLK